MLRLTPGRAIASCASVNSIPINCSAARSVSFVTLCAGCCWACCAFAIAAPAVASRLVIAAPAAAAAGSSLTNERRLIFAFFSAACAGRRVRGFFISLLRKDREWGVGNGGQRSYVLDSPLPTPDSPLPIFSFFSVQSSARPVVEILFARRAFGSGAAITDFALFFCPGQFLHGAESFQRQFAGRNDRAVGLLFDLTAADGFDQTGRALKFPQSFFVGGHIADRQRVSVIEMVERLSEIDSGEARAEDFAAGFTDQVARDSFGPDLFALVFELDLAGDGRDRGVNVADARGDQGLAVKQGAALGVRRDALHDGYRQALADAGAFIDAFVLARDERDLFDDFADGLRDQKSQLVMIRVVAVIAVAVRPRLLPSDLDSFLDRGRIMCLNLGADAVFERRDDLASRRVVFGVGREDQQHV